MHYTTTWWFKLIAFGSLALAVISVAVQGISMIYLPEYSQGVAALCCSIVVTYVMGAIVVMCVSGYDERDFRRTRRLEYDIYGYHANADGSYDDVYRKAELKAQRKRGTKQQQKEN